MNKDVRNIAIVVLLVLGAWLLFRKKERPAATPVSRTVAASKATNNQKGQVLLEETVVRKKSEIEAERKAFNRMTSLGVQRIPTQMQGGNVKFSVVFDVGSAGCSAGEFDLIKHTTNDITKKTVVFAIDATDSSSSRPLFQTRISALDIASGLQLRPSLPNVGPEGRGYQISMCVDKSNTNECRSKKPLEAKDWPKAMNSKNDSHAFLFYTQMFVIQDGTAFLLPTHQFSDKALEDLRDSLHLIWKKVVGFDKFAEEIQALRPIPATVKQQNLSLPLPALQRGC